MIPILNIRGGGSGQDWPWVYFHGEVEDHFWDKAFGKTTSAPDLVEANAPFPGDGIHIVTIEGSNREAAAYLWHDEKRNGLARGLIVFLDDEKAKTQTEKAYKERYRWL